MTQFSQLATLSICKGLIDTPVVNKSKARRRKTKALKAISETEKRVSAKGIVFCELLLTMS